MIEERNGYCLLRVFVQPKSRQASIVGVHGDALKIRVTSPPEKGAANKECIGILGEAFHLKRRDITLVGGVSSRKKVFRIAAPAKEVKKALQDILEGL